MPVDPNIILGIRPAQFDNQVDVARSASALQQAGYQNQMMQRQMSDDQATRSAYQQSMTAGPDGAPTLDRSKLLSTLAQANPLLAYKQQQELAQQDSVKAKSDMEVDKARHEKAAEIAWSIPTDASVSQEQKQTAWTAARNKAIALNLPGASDSPEQHPGDSFVKQFQLHTLDATKQAELGAKDKENQIKHEENSIKREQIGIERENKMAQDLGKHLSQGWAGRSGQAGQVQGKMNNAEYLEGLITQGKGQPGGLDARQVEEVAQGTARMLGGSAAASARVDALLPHSAIAKGMTALEWLSNKPQGAELQAFTDRMAETVAREKGIAQEQMKKFQVEGLAEHAAFKKRNPSLYNSILQEKGITPDMIDEKGRYKSPASDTKVYNGVTYKIENGHWVPQ